MRCSIATQECDSRCLNCAYSQPDAQQTDGYKLMAITSAGKLNLASL